jgi:hypothetical protein
MKNFKRALITADYHSGHLVGLTPPEHWESESTKWGMTERMCWQFYTEMVDKYKPYDLHVINGDAIAGKNKKSGSRQLITADMKDQCGIAKQAILFSDCKVLRITRGTGYHVGSEDNWENVLADMLKLEDVDVKIKNHGFYVFNGKNIDVKHKLSGSTIPHGRLTALAKEILWARIWNDRGVQPSPDILIRSHVHYYEQIHHDGCYGISTPALQGLGDEYGEQQCSGTVDFGIIVIDVFDSGEIRIYPEIMKGESQSSKPEVL